MRGELRGYLCNFRIKKWIHLPSCLSTRLSIWLQQRSVEESSMLTVGRIWMGNVLHFMKVNTTERYRVERGKDDREPDSLVRAEFRHSTEFQHGHTWFSYGEYTTEQQPLLIQIYLTWLRHKCSQTREWLNSVYVKFSLICQLPLPRSSDKQLNNLNYLEQTGGF